MSGWRKRHITNTDNPVDFPEEDIDAGADSFARVIDQMVLASLKMSDKGYELSTHEKQAEFARKRNNEDKS